MSKLSEELTQFSKDVAKLAPAERDKIYSAIRASFGPVKASRTTSSGEVVETREVDFSVIDQAMPPELRVDWRQIQRSMFDAGKRHGNAWADESYAYILTKYVLPQKTAGELLVSGTPGLLEALEKAGFVRNTPSSSTT